MQTESTVINKIVHDDGREEEEGTTVTLYADGRAETHNWWSDSRPFIAPKPEGA